MAGPDLALGPAPKHLPRCGPAPGPSPQAHWLSHQHRPWVMRSNWPYSSQPAFWVRPLRDTPPPLMSSRVASGHAPHGSLSLIGHFSKAFSFVPLSLGPPLSGPGPLLTSLAGHAPSCNWPRLLGPAPPGPLSLWLRPAFCADSLELLGSPSPTLTVRLRPPALSTARSPEPRAKVTLRVPPPPQPSFFTRNCSLWGEEEAWGRQLGPGRGAGCGAGGVRVAEGEGQGPPRRLLEALAQEADELGLEDALQEAVGGVLLEDEEVVLSRAGGGRTGGWQVSGGWGRRGREGAGQEWRDDQGRAQVQQRVMGGNGRGQPHLRDTPLKACSSNFFFKTSRTWPFSGPFFTFSRPITYTHLGVRIKSRLMGCGCAGPVVGAWSRAGAAWPRRIGPRHRGGGGRSGEVCGSGERGPSLGMEACELLLIDSFLGSGNGMQGLTCAGQLLYH